jgi:hypothetical protein
VNLAALTRADPVKDVGFIRGGWNSSADPLVSPADRAVGKTTNTRMIINACRPYAWRDEFLAGVKPSGDMARRQGKIRLARSTYGHGACAPLPLLQGEGQR